MEIYILISFVVYGKQKGIDVNLSRKWFAL